jgi:hypothetical protein
VKPPIPETKSPRLPSAGYRDERYTQHVYLETRPTMLPGPAGAAWEFVFVCQETGAERRWGVCERDQDPEPRDIN